MRCKVVVGGTPSNNKGINKLGGGLSAPALTDKDKGRHRFAARASRRTMWPCLRAFRRRRPLRAAAAARGLAVRGIIVEDRAAEALDCIEEIIDAS